MKALVYTWTAAIVLAVLGCSSMEKPNRTSLHVQDSKNSSTPKLIGQADRTVTPTNTSKQETSDSSPKLASINWTEIGGKDHLVKIANKLTQLRLKNGQFTTNIDDLGSNITAETNTYAYEITVEDEKSYAYVTATPKTSDLSSYVNGIFLKPGILAYTYCKSDKPSQFTPPAPAFGETAAECPTGFTDEDA